MALADSCRFGVCNIDYVVLLGVWDKVLCEEAEKQTVFLWQK